MKVAFVASPMRSLSSGEVLAEIADGWTSVRPDDELHVVSISEGVAGDLGSGVECLFDDLATCWPHLLGSGSFRRVSWESETHLLVDYSAFAGTMREGYSTGIIAQDILERGVGKTSIDLLVPPLALWADGGVDLLARLAQVAGDDGFSGASVARESDVSWVGEAVRRARLALKGTRLRVLVAWQQAFVGLAGVARRSAVTLGNSGAQERERSFSAFAHALASAEPSRESLLPGRGDHSHNVHYEGCGSGAAGVLEALGAQILPLDMLITAKARDVVNNVDLVIYITPRVEENLPPGLLALSQLCETSAHPLVLVYERGALRKGEFPNLGLSGAYELAVGHEGEEEGTAMGALLQRRGRALATTWGW